MPFLGNNCSMLKVYYTEDTFFSIYALMGLSCNANILFTRLCAYLPCQHRFVCRLCLEFVASGLQLHQRAHRVCDQPCSLCSGRFVGGDLSRHLRDFHRVVTDDDDSKAPVLAEGWCTVRACRAPCASWEANVSHFIDRHWKENPDRLCTMCLYYGPTVAQATKHSALHATGNRQFQCDRCSATFLNASRRKRHMLVFHKQSYVPRANSK